MNFPWEDVPRQISTNPAIWVCTVQSACSTWCDYGVAAHAKTWHLTQPHYQTLKGSSVTCSRSSLWSWLTVCNQQSDRKQEGFRFCSTSHSRVNTFYDSLKTFNFAVFSAVALRVCADVFPVSRFARQVNNDFVLSVEVVICTDRGVSLVFWLRIFRGEMKSLMCLLASVRAASPFPLNCGSVRKRTSVEFGSNTARCLQITRGTDLKLMSEAAVPLLRKRDTGPSWDRTGRRTAPQKAPGAALSPYIPYTKPQSKAAALFDIQSLFEEDVIAEPHHPSDSQTNCCDGEAQLPATGEGFLIFSEFINRSYVLHIYYKSAVMCHCSVPHQCSSQMFKKLESILSERFSQFQPRSLVDVMHACIHLERFPLNYMTKVFSPHFLQKLQGTRRAFISDCEKQEERKKSVTVHFWVFPYFLSERDDVCYLLLKHSGWETLFCFLNLTFSLVAVTLF